MFAIEYDIVLAMGKIRRAGFTRHSDTLEGFLKRFDEYRRARIIPTLTLVANSILYSRGRLQRRESRAAGP
jgi:hypothetical protein